MRKPARGLGPLGKSQISRLLGASAGEGQQPRLPLFPAPMELGETPSGGAHERRHDDELRQRGGWSGPRPLQDEIQDDLLVEKEEPEELAGLGPSHGIWIAAATFVPTFVATFFGVAYLAGLRMETRSLAGLKAGPPVVSSLAPERGFVVAPPQAQAPMMSSERLPMRAVGHADEPPRLPSPPTREALGNAAVPATTPAIPRPASRPTRPQVARKAAAPKSPASTVTKGNAWLLAASFADRDSTERLAASIERQGYPTKVRRDGTPSTSWAVWIGKHPRGMTPFEWK